MAYIYPFRMASGTATMLIIDHETESFCNGIRSKDAWVYPGCNSLPGGFMEARFTEDSESEVMKICRGVSKESLNFKLVGDEYHEGEDLELCALRELREELGVDFDREQLNLFAVRSNSRTDTRAHVINACFWLEATPEQIKAIKAGDDLEDVEWIPIIQVMNEPIEMAFNHMEVTYQGLRAYNKAKFFEKLVFDWDKTIKTGIFKTHDLLLQILEKKVANG